MSRPWHAVGTGLLAVVLAAGGAIAQDPSPGGELAPGAEPSPGPAPTRCAAWAGDEQSTVSSGAALAMLGPKRPPASGPSECRLPVDDIDVLRSPDLWIATGLLDAIPVQDLYRVTDGSDDVFRLDGEPIDGSPDPATNILGVHFGRFALDRSGSRALVRALGDPDVAGEALLGQPANKLFMPGEEYDLFAIDLAGDPTQDPAGNRIFQIVFMGADPRKSVPVTIPETNPLAGGRHVVTIFQQPGDPPDAALLSDFGSRKLGPDGQTQYYNAPSRVFAVPTPNGIIAITPASLNPAGFRVEAFDAITGAWDLVGAPDGPMAFIPTDGSAPSTIQLPILQLFHDPVEGQDLLLGDQRLEDHTLPSGDRLLGTTVEPLPDPFASIDLDVEGRQLLYQQIEAALLENQPIIAVTWGIPMYGRYCIPRTGEIALHGPNGEPLLWSDGSPVTWDAAELRRGIGTGCWIVGQEEGVLHQAAVGEWLGGIADGDGGMPPYDPELAEQMLREAGWVTDDDGIRTYAGG